MILRGVFGRGIFFYEAELVWFVRKCCLFVKMEFR
jgi:hypothetical protein